MVFSGLHRQHSTDRAHFGAVSPGQARSFPVVRCRARLFANAFHPADDSAGLRNGGQFQDPRGHLHERLEYRAVAAESHFQSTPRFDHSCREVNQLQNHRLDSAPLRGVMHRLRSPSSPG